MKTRKRNARSPRVELASHARLAVTDFDGELVQLVYRRGGRKYVHDFKRPPKLYLADDGKHLIAAPIRVRAGQLEG